MCRVASVTIKSRWMFANPLAVTIIAPFGDRAKARDGALDLAGVAHADRIDLHPERLPHRLNDAELARAGG